MESPPRRALWDNVDQRLAWDHDIWINGELLKIICFNTSWLSKIHERQGRLLLPADKIIFESNSVEFQIAALHHPLKWLDAMNANQVRKHLLEASDNIFTGHEHQVATIKTELVGFGASTFHESLAFQLDVGKGDEGFTGMYVDTNSQEQIKIDFIWNLERFTPFQKGQKVSPLETLLPLQLERNPYRENRNWEFTREAQERLDDPEIDLFLEVLMKSVSGRYMFARI